MDSGSIIIGIRLNRTKVNLAARLFACRDRAEARITKELAENIKTNHYREIHRGP